METGVLAGYEMVDAAVVLIDGSYHDVDSSEMAFKIAGSMAFKEACKRANPKTARADHARRSGGAGRIHGPGDRGPELAARADAGTRIARRDGNHQRAVPLAEMFGYATEIRSRTQGRGSFTMHFSHYEQAPGNIAEEMIGRANGDKPKK